MWSPSSSLLLIIITILTITSHGLGITTQLIHRDSPLSPVYDPTKTITDRAREAATSSLAREVHFSSLFKYNNMNYDDVKVDVPLVPATVGVFFLNFSVGNPPVQQWAIMDTGSSKTWVRCKSCVWCDVKYPKLTFFDPSKSRSYSAVPCGDSSCDKCTEFDPKQCMYSEQYGGGSISKGVYGTDQLTFKDTTVPNILFGCATSFHLKPRDLEQTVNGIFALGLAVERPLVGDMGNRFSFCTDTSDTGNRLSFGKDAKLLGSSTPYKSSNYHVGLVNIGFSTRYPNVLSGITPEMLYTMNSQGVVIDSGGSLVRMYYEAFNVVVAEIGKQAFGIFTEVRSPIPWYQLCYKGIAERDAMRFPSLYLQLQDYVYLEMDASKGLFTQVTDDVFCLGIVNSTSFTIIGMNALQQYNVGFDLIKQRIHFWPISDCKSLDY